ncbi:acylphosphatase [Liquorilactobacillus cacaonum]|nr:acylphosphatase [Liquorilactobacillus cacaonum]
MKSIKMTIYGRVQGVGFRYCTKMIADQLGITGIVKNQLDGSVYLEAQGPSEKLSDFTKKIIASPTPSGKVTRYTLEEIQLQNFTSFNITY